MPLDANAWMLLIASGSVMMLLSRSAPGQIFKPVERAQSHWDPRCMKVMDSSSLGRVTTMDCTSPPVDTEAPCAGAADACDLPSRQPVRLSAFLQIDPKGCIGETWTRTGVMEKETCSNRTLGRCSV